MSKVHELNCAEDRRNVGFGGCVIDWKIIKGAFISDAPRILSAEEVATLQDSLQDMAWADDKPGRIYPIHGFLNPTDNTEAPTIQTFSDGSKAFVRDGTYDWEFQFTRGGFSLLQALASHDSNGNTYVLFYDKDNKLLGYRSGDTIAFIPQQIFKALPWKMNNGSATAEYKVKFVFDSVYANEQAEFVKASFPLSEITGLKDIRPVVLDWDDDAGEASIKLVNEADGSNLYDLYSGDIDEDLFTAVNEETGGAVTITSVTPNAASKAFDFVFDNADPDYPVDGTIVVSGVTPSAMATAGLSGYEIETIRLDVSSGS